MLEGSRDPGWIIDEPGSAAAACGIMSGSDWLPGRPGRPGDRSHCSAVPLDKKLPRAGSGKKEETNMKKIIALLVIAALMLTGAAFAKGTYLGTMTVVKCKSWVTLRERPSTSARTVARVPYGENVDAYYFNSRFTECYYRGLHGYILSDYLADGYYRDYQRYEPGDSTEQNADYDNFLGSMRVVNCKNWVTLRSSPNTRASTVTRIPLGEYVEAYKYNDRFVECYYKGMHGYVLKKYLR